MGESGLVFMKGIMTKLIFSAGLAAALVFIISQLTKLMTEMVGS